MSSVGFQAQHVKVVEGLPRNDPKAASRIIIPHTAEGVLKEIQPSQSRKRKARSLDDIQPPDVDWEIVDEHQNDRHSTVVGHKHQRPRKKARLSDVDRNILPADKRQSDRHPTVVKHEQQPRKALDDVWPSDISPISSSSPTASYLPRPVPATLQSPKMGFSFSGDKMSKRNPAGTSESNQQPTPRSRQGRRSKVSRGSAVPVISRVG